MARLSRPDLSIIIPCYNAGSFLREAVESALQGSRVEVIIQDSLSDGETLQVLQGYEEDPRVIVVREKDFGQADALNRALRRASGGWIGWLNADDLYTDGAVKAVLEAIDTAQTQDCSVLYGDWNLVDRDGKVLRAYRVGAWNWSRILRRGCYMFSGATFIRKKDLEEVGGLDSSLHFCMDLDLFLRLGPAIQARKIQMPLGALRIHGRSKTSTRGYEFIGEAFRVRRRHGQGVLEQVIAYRAYCIAMIYVIAQPIRFSKPYSRLRPTKDI
jgi:glycosyltransferase involved in cell wall biosynthesis